MSDEQAAPTVMVVEDYDDARFLIRQVLERRGCRVVEAQTGVEAVTLARREALDLILMDLGLPLIDGVSATLRIREIGSLAGVPIVAITAYDSDEVRASARAAGCDEFIAKPISAEQLDGVLDRHLPPSARHQTGEN